MSRPITVFSLLAAVWATGGSAQNCPAIQSCPHTLQNICDQTLNDSLLWNAPSFTWNPALQSADLPEASTDLELLVKDTCPGALTIKFALFLDLDGDNLTESVVTSDQVLPGGKMLFTNAFNPGYTGTDTIVFDNRSVPDSLKFRFAVETVNNNGIITAHLRWSTAAAPTGYLAARLPGGRHEITWTVVKNGGAPKTCNYAFRIKDCQPPLLECLSGWGASIPVTDTLTLAVDDFLQLAEDNITPNALLQRSMRRAGTGIGFPVDANGQGVTQLSFTCPDLGFQNIEIWLRDLAGNTVSCEAGVTLYDFAGHCIPTVDPVVCATTVFVNTDTLRQVDYILETLPEPGLPAVNLSVTRLSNGCGELPDFSAYPIAEVSVRPRKSDHPLNGVSTFDLVLINRHILGVQLFNKTWKYLAADANNSGGLTTLDIIELRKLILGLYDSLPKSPSWKFFIADCPLDSLQPFQSVCPGSIVFAPEFMPANLNFLAIKTGDVNGNASPDSLAPAMTEDREPLRLLFPDRWLAAGETADLPVYLLEPAEWIGCQWALGWDPALLTFQNILPGALTGLDGQAVALPRPGELRVSWFDRDARWLLPGAPLCTLRVQARQALRLRNVLHELPGPLHPEAYSDEGAVTPLQIEFREMLPTAGTGLEIFGPQPNPARGSAVFPLRLSAPGAASLKLYDAAGQLVFRTEQVMEAGAGILELPASAHLPAGVYTWRVQAGGATGAGRLVLL